MNYGKFRSYVLIMVLEAVSAPAVTRTIIQSITNRSLKVLFTFKNHLFHPPPQFCLSLSVRLSTLRQCTGFCGGRFGGVGGLAVDWERRATAGRYPDFRWPGSELEEGKRPVSALLRFEIRIGGDTFSPRTHSPLLPSLRV